MFMKRNDSSLRSLPKAVPPAHEAEEAPRTHPKLSEHAPSAREEAVLAVSAPVKPSVVSSHADSEVVQPVAPPSKPTPSASPAPSTTGAAAPDAGWVKPAWAIPDEEPRRVRDSDARDAGK